MISKKRRGARLALCLITALVMVVTLIPTMSFAAATPDKTFTNNATDNCPISEVQLFYDSSKGGGSYLR